MPWTTWRWDRASGGRKSALSLLPPLRGSVVENSMHGGFARPFRARSPPPVFLRGFAAASPAVTPTRLWLTLAQANNECLVWHNHDNTTTYHHGEHSELKTRQKGLLYMVELNNQTTLERQIRGNTNVSTNSAKSATLCNLSLLEGRKKNQDAQQQGKMRRGTFLHRRMSDVLQWEEDELQPDTSQLRRLFLQALA